MSEHLLNFWKNSGEIDPSFGQSGVAHFDDCHYQNSRVEVWIGRPSTLFTWFDPEWFFSFPQSQSYCSEEKDFRKMKTSQHQWTYILKKKFEVLFRRVKVDEVTPGEVCRAKRGLSRQIINKKILVLLLC